jgi:hypothetical protein
MRGVAIAMKLADLAEYHGFGQDAEEQWLVWAVEEILRIIRNGRHSGTDISTLVSSQKQPKSTAGQAPTSTATTRADSLTGIDLPKWASVTDVGAPIQALAAFYAKVGKAE